jgi:hypothetical protein
MITEAHLKAWKAYYVDPDAAINDVDLSQLGNEVSKATDVIKALLAVVSIDPFVGKDYKTAYEDVLSVVSKQAQRIEELTAALALYADFAPSWAGEDFEAYNTPDTDHVTDAGKKVFSIGDRVQVNRPFGSPYDGFIGEITEIDPTSPTPYRVDDTADEYCLCAENELKHVKDMKPLFKIGATVWTEDKINGIVRQICQGENGIVYTVSPEDKPDVRITYEEYMLDHGIPF